MWHHLSQIATALSQIRTSNLQGRMSPCNGELDVQRLPPGGTPMKNNRLLGILAVFGSLSVATQGATAQDTVKIGMVMPLSGPLAAAGNQVVAGARFYM